MISTTKNRGKTTPVYQAGLIKRRRRTKAQIEQLRAQIYDALTEDSPQSVRHVFYCMTDPRLAEPVEKSEHGYGQVQYLLKIMRQDGSIPYGWITDATRRGHHIRTFDDAADFITRMSGLYRGDLWRRAGHYVEVWTERRRPDIQETVEGEAMKPSILRGMLRDKIESFLPAGEMIAIRAAELSEREHLKRIAVAIRGTA